MAKLRLRFEMKDYSGEWQSIIAHLLAPGLYIHRTPTKQNYWYLIHKSGLVIRAFTDKPRPMKNILEWVASSGVLFLDWNRSLEYFETASIVSDEAQAYRKAVASSIN